MWRTARLLTVAALILSALGCARGEKAEDSEEAMGGGAEATHGGGQGAGSAGGGGHGGSEPSATTVVVPAGTTFTIALDEGLSSKTSRPGDAVRAHVVGGISSQGELVVPDGAAAMGTVAEVEGSGRVSGRAILAMNITSLETAGGKEGVQTTMVEGALRAEGTKKRDIATIVGGTAAGAVLGEILGDEAKLGAIIGAAAGTGVVLATKGKELTLDPGTQIDLKLVSPLTVAVPGRPGA
jgi:hypothetical protein